MPRGGAREGAGRPKGSKDPHTLEREAVLAEYRTRVCDQAQRLLDAELAVAQGCSYLYRKPKQAEKGQKERKAERVENPEIIRQYLDGELDDDANDYYYITTEKPDTMTIRGMLDRTFDRPAQRMELTGEGGSNLVPQAVTFVIQKQPGSDNQT
jgi:hypothetical protein